MYVLHIYYNSGFNGMIFNLIMIEKSLCSIALNNTKYLIDNSFSHIESDRTYLEIFSMNFSTGEPCNIFQRQCSFT